MPDINKMFPTKYLNPLDLNEKTHIVTISREEMVRLPNNDEETLIIYFEGRDKGLVINQTTGRTLGLLLGRHTEGWIGKQIELYTTVVEHKGKTRPMIHVRSPRKADAPQNDHQENGIDPSAPVEQEAAYE